MRGRAAKRCGTALGAAATLFALGMLLGVKWLNVVAAIVAAVGAVARLMLAARRARLEGAVERAQLARLLRVEIMSVKDVDPTLIGIDPAEQTILPGGTRPRYVRRAADDQLQAAVADAVADSGRWIVVANGPSKVGKSRSLFEALRAQSTPLDLVAPVDAAALKSVVMPGAGLRAGSGATVLWLDDLEPFLNG